MHHFERQLSFLYYVSISRGTFTLDASSLAFFKPLHLGGTCRRKLTQDIASNTQHKGRRQQEALQIFEAPTAKRPCQRSDIETR